MTKWNCGKSGSPEHWPLSIFFYPFSVEMGENMKCFLNSHFFLITWDQGLVPVQESKGPHLEVTHLPATKEWTIPSTDQNSLCPDLVNTSLGVKQLEFCLSKEVNAVAKEYYCSKLLSNIRCWIQKEIHPLLQCDVFSRKNPLSYRQSAVCFL